MDGADGQVLNVLIQDTFHLYEWNRNGSIDRLEGNKKNNNCNQLYFGNVLRWIDDFHERSVNDLPTFLKTGTEFNVRFLHFQLDLQHLRFDDVAVFLQDGGAKAAV